MSGRSPVEILEQAQVVAVVGIAEHPGKESHRVPAALASIGFRIVPVHPSADEILGEKAYRSVAEIPFRVDVVDVFRPPDEIPEITQQAIAAGVEAVWTQIGLYSSEARELAEAAGIDFVESKCMATVSAVAGIDKR